MSMQPNTLMQLDAMGPVGIMMMAMMLVWVLAIGAVIWLVWRAIRRRSGGRGSSSRGFE